MLLICIPPHPTNNTCLSLQQTIFLLETKESHLPHTPSPAYYKVVYSLTSTQLELIVFLPSPMLYMNPGDHQRQLLSDSDHDATPKYHWKNHIFSVFFFYCIQLKSSSLVQTMCQFFSSVRLISTSLPSITISGPSLLIFTLANLPTQSSQHLLTIQSTISSVLKCYCLCSQTHTTWHISCASQCQIQ